MKTKNILELTFILCLFWMDSVGAQVSYTMSFTTGATGHHKTDATQIQQNEQSFVGIALYSDKVGMDTQNSSENSNTGTKSYNSHLSGDSSSLTIEKGHSIQTTHLNYKESYTSTTYDFSYGVNFEY